VAANMVLNILRNPSLKPSFRKIQQPVSSIQLNVTILHTVSQLKQNNKQNIIDADVPLANKTTDFLTVMFVYLIAGKLCPD
jgi:hypothetical protein